MSALIWSHLEYCFMYGLQLFGISATDLQNINSGVIVMFSMVRVVAVEFSQVRSRYTCVANVILARIGSQCNSMRACVIITATPTQSDDNASECILDTPYGLSRSTDIRRAGEQSVTIVQSDGNT